MAGAVVGTSDSRVALALLVALAAFAILAAVPLLGLRVRRVSLAAGVPLAAAVLAHLFAGGYSAPGAPADSAAALGLLVVVGGAVAAWALVLQSVPGVRQPAHRTERDGRRLGIVVAGVATVVMVAGAFAFGADDAAPGVEPVSGFDHGRAAEWEVAIDAALARPLAGAGADAYAMAAVGEGGGETLYAHNLPLEAWAELGPLGLILILLLYGSVAELCWRLRRDPRAWLLAPAAAAFLLANLVDWPWHLAGAAAVWAVAVGGLVALDLEREQEPAP